MLCPDLRGLGWSGQPVDGDERKQRMADDAIALLDALGLERVRLVGHDWGGWAAILAAAKAPERFSSLLLLGIGHPWVPRALAARNAHRLLYQLPLYFPPVTSHGGAPRRVLEVARRDGAGWAPGEVDAYVSVIRTQARATGRLYRSFARCRSRAIGNRSLPGLAVPRVAPAPLAVLAQRDAIGVVPLGLVGLVVPALALLAREGDGDPDVSTCHVTARSEGRGPAAPGKEKPRTGARSASEDSAGSV